jgi:hypothetical protein
MKKSSIKYAGEVNELGKLEVYNKRTFKLEILTHFKSKNVWVEISERTGHRSKQQNAYLHAVVIPRYCQALRREQGYQLDEVETKQYLCKKFLTSFKVQPNGDNLEITKGTSDLDKQEMTVFIEAIIMDAAENLFEVIPFPNEADNI